MTTIHQEKENEVNVYPGVVSPVEEPTIEEPLQTINKINAKAPPSDNIPPKLLKYGKRL